MTATPSMNTKTTMTGTMLAVLGVVALAVVLQVAASSGLGAGWRSTNAAAVPQTTFSEARGSNAQAAAAEAGDISLARGRN